MSLFPNYIKYDVSFVKGEGAVLWDEAGKTYLDFGSGIGVTNLGHHHPALTHALIQQIHQLWHVSNLFPISLQEEVASLLCRHSGLGAAFFCNSGAEANEAAIKLARKWAKEEKKVLEPEIITFEGSFHGRTLATLTATGQEKVKTGFGPLPAGFITVPFENIDAVKQATNPQTAAILLEMVKGEGGVYPASYSFVQELANWCEKNNILLIVDEVQTGIGRTGEWFSFQHYGIWPDVITLAKGLGNGFPIGAMLAKEALKPVFRPGTHGTTFGGNPLAMTVAKTVLTEIENNNLLHDVKEKGRYFLESLKEELSDSEAVIAIRGLGLMIGIQLSKPVAPIIKQLLKQGIVTLPAGENVLRLLPPLVVTYEQLNQAVHLIKEAVCEPTQLTIIQNGG
ncbi:acetylornithine transaminase [Shimazuella sp. AN120528]|uniref:acetylornithine transaminase n=1 Tax=Shimazuella soli TaxID=1892854 RepID=UPI001F0E842A|nr:acetylornithine transaminase [Shimazuella soli]MCH5585353.1 acetylornithine transaminase [Shimazuella soli]